MKMESRSTDLANKQKKDLRVQHTFFTNIIRKKKLHVFVFFCTTKESNFLVTHYFHGGIVAFIFSLQLIFTWLLTFFIFSLPL